MIKRVLFFLLLYAGSFQVKAQEPLATPATDTSERIVVIKHADRLTLKKADSTNELQIAAGNVFFEDGDTRFYCDSAIRNKNDQTIQAFGHVHIIDSDTIHTYSDYLIYHIDTKLAVLEKNVKLTDGSGVLTTQNLDYDTNLKIGNYHNGGKVVRDKTVITSLEATYYAELKDVYFKNDVKLKDPGYDLISDSLLYNTETQLANFITDTYIKDTSNMEIVTSSGYYDLKNKISQLSGRSTVKDKALTVTGDELAMDDNSGLFEAQGNAIMIDTVQGVTVIANNIKANRQNSTFLATQHPLMILKQDNDSIYVTADTLFSGLLKDAEAAEKALQASRDSAAAKNKMIADSLALEARTRLQDSMAATGRMIPADSTSDSSFRSNAIDLRDSAYRERRLLPGDTSGPEPIATPGDSTMRKGLPVTPDSTALKAQAAQPDKRVSPVNKDQDTKKNKRKNRAKRRKAATRKDSAIPVQKTLPVIKDTTYPENIRAQEDSAGRTDSAISPQNVRPALKDSVPLKNAAVQRDSMRRTDLRALTDSIIPEDTRVLPDSTLTAPALPDDTMDIKKGLPKDTLAATAPVDTTSRYFKGFRNVRIFSDSLQAVCDSLFYSGRDSVFQLFQDPILWANKSQVTGDTIYLYTKNKKPARLKVIENSMMINQLESDYFNQVSGKTIEVFFRDGSPDSVEVIGSPAESVYYVQDEDSSFVGMNTATARIINMYFVNKELSRVVFRKEPEGTMFPIRQIPSEKKSLRDFKWLEDRRPKTRFELFEDIEQTEPDDSTGTPLRTDPAPGITDTLQHLKDSIPAIKGPQRHQKDSLPGLPGTRDSLPGPKDTLPGTTNPVQEIRVVATGLTGESPRPAPPGPDGTMMTAADTQPRRSEAAVPFKRTMHPYITFTA